MAELKDYQENELADLMRDLARVARTIVRSPADAEDIVQSAFYAGLRKGELRNPRAYLIKVVKTLFVSNLRKAGRRREQYGLDLAQTPFDAFTEQDQEEWQELIEAKIRQLDAPLQRFVTLWMAGLTFVEIGKKVDLPEKTVSRRFHRACDSLRRLLEADGCRFVP